MGWQVIIMKPDSEENSTAQKDAITSLINKKVRFISLNSLNPEDLAPEIINATDAGIPVYMHNTLTPVSNLNITTYIGYNQFNGAAEMGFYAARKLAEKKNEDPETVQGKVFILRGLPGFHADQRTAGFITGLSHSPGIRIIGEEVAGWDRDTAKNITLAALKNDSNIDIFYGNSDEMAIGAALAVQEQGKEVNKDIFCLGIDGNNPTLEMIRNGTMTATLGVYPDRIGRVIVEQMKTQMTGGNISRFIETPYIVVDRENLDSYLNYSTWTGAYESEAEILHSPQ